MGIFSGSEKAKADNTKAWQPGDICYTWLANGMLESVITPEGKTVTFEYDALGRRAAKTSDGTARMFCWDGNVLLHEWDCRENERPRLVTDDMGREGYDREVTFENVITWVYDGQNFTPVAKVTEQERYTIVHDYLGTPTQAYDSKGKLVWEMLLDVYGNAKEYVGEKCFIPFRYQGQYEDNETCLYYNRFRYYAPNQGNYISQDPIGLAGNNPTLYGYVNDINLCLDLFGLVITPNKAAGLKREAIARAWLQEKYPNATIFSERYIRDEDGVSVRDLSNSRRRLDFVVVENNKVIGIYEVTSPTADKRSQMIKEEYIRANKGTHIKAPGRKGALYDISNIKTHRIDVDLEMGTIKCH